MSPYSMHCSVCDTSWKTRKEWLNHLLTDKHQRQARQRCYHWDESVKECSLVTFTQFAVVKLNIANELLDYFTVGRTIVTDFIYWAHRPRVAILQFESRSIVDEILAKGPQKTVGRSIVQLRRAVDCFQLEWDELLSKTTVISKLKKSNLETTSIKSSVSGTPDESLVSGFTNNWPSLQIKNMQLKENFADILHQLSFPRDHLYAAAHISQRLSVFCRNYFGSEAFCHVIWVRHYYLRFPNTGMNQHTIFIDCRRDFKDSSEPDIVCSLSKNLKPTEWLNVSTIGNLKQVKFPPNSLTTNDTCQENFEEFGTLFEYIFRSQRHEFRIVTDPILAPEAYTCNFLTYICKFDTRVLPLIHLVSYWAKLNDKKFTKCLVTRVIGDVIYSPEPSLMEWLVVFFMCTKRIIPTPRQLIDLPHFPVLFGKWDIGFRVYPDYVNEWVPSSGAPAPSDSAEFALNVCQLAKEFFQFLNNLNSEPFVLNMRDGELIKEREFRTDAQTRDWGKWLSEEEMAMTRAKLSDETPLTIVHPLVQCQSFSFDREVFAGPKWSKALAKTVNNLKKFCDIFENEKSATATINLGLALTCKSKK